MNESPAPPPSPPVARIDRRRRISAIWIIPLVTVLIAIWLAYDTLSRRGPLITITFESAEGLTAGQSQVRYKAIPLGTIQRITLSPDYTHVIITARMNNDATRLLTTRARFWVVKPRLFAGNISGLGTILSGSYIALLPSTAPAPPARHFTGLENPPVLQSDVPGRTFLLQASRLGSLNLGSPIFYRGFDVGTVLGWDVGDMAKSVTVHAFVRAPFDSYVHRSSRFWNVSGASVSLGATGVHVDIESLQALLLGGIAFNTPAGAEKSPVATERDQFPLYSNYEDAQSSVFHRSVAVVAYFHGSVSGLGPGASVTMLGIPVGRVTSVDLRFDRQSDSLEVPVHFTVQPGRIAESEAVEQRGPFRNAQILVAHGMRAELSTANFLTGQQEIALVFVPNAAPAAVTEENGVIVVPTAPGTFSGISQSAAVLLDKINQMPFQQIGENLNATLAGLGKIANSSALRDSLTSLQSTLVAARDTLKKLDQGAGPALADLPVITRQLQALLIRATGLIASADTGYGANSQFSRNLERLLVQANDLMQSLSALANLLTEQPNALIRGRIPGPTQ